MSSTWGENIKISIFGESHSAGIGIVLDGIPAGFTIDFAKILNQIKRRAPGNDQSSTSRKELDFPKILSGILNGVTEGSPISAIIENTNTKSADYQNLLNTPRPGHSDFCAYVKYKQHNDIKGGGHFSGRLTAPLVFAGSVARQILETKNIFVTAHAQRIAKIDDNKFCETDIDLNLAKKLIEEFFPVINKNTKEKMYEEISKAKSNGDSVGGIIECAVIGLPVGIGGAMFGGLESKISSIVYGIPAVKAIEFGAGFSSCDMFGSENNDEFYYDDKQAIKTYTNNCGGILGGISNSMPLIFRVGIKPTPSIYKEQRTVNLQTKENEKLIINGRHDPCIVPRAIPVIEAVTALAILDAILGDKSYDL